MSKRKAQLLGVGILMLGIVVALPFRRQQRGELAARQSPRPELQLQQTEATSPSTAVILPGEEPPAKAGTSRPPTPVTTSSTMRPVKSVDKVPALAEKYPPRPMVPERPPAPLTSDEKPRRHTLTNGDTLPNLAERYLGSPDRYGEILQANPELQPGLLPLRTVIVIPPKFPPTVRRRPRTKLVPVE